MERDSWDTVARRFADLENPESVGRMAAQRAIRRLNAVKVETQKVPGQSFDRWLCTAWVVDDRTGEVLSVADRMISWGYARPYDGKKPRGPWDPTSTYPIERSTP